MALRGIGAELAVLAMEHAFDWLDAPVVRVTGEDVPMPYAANLEKLALPNAERIVAAVRQVTYSKPNRRYTTGDIPCRRKF